MSRRLIKIDCSTQLHSIKKKKSVLFVTVLIYYFLNITFGLLTVVFEKCLKNILLYSQTFVLTSRSIICLHFVASIIQML